MLQPFGRNIWITDGETVAVAGFRYPTRMAVIKLPDGNLFVWSPTAMSDGLRAEMEALGHVRFIVAPNSLHHLFLPAWHDAYPNATLYAAPGLREKRRDIVFGGELGDAPETGWSGQIDQVAMRGNLITTEIVFFHRESGVVLFTDLIQHFPPGWFSGWRAFVARLDRLVGREAAVPQKFRVAFVNRQAARAALARVLAWPAEKVLMAHGVPIEKDGRAFLARAFQWLRR
jgi:hypothetical protein